MGEVVIYLAWVHFTALAYKLQQEFCLLPKCSRPGLVISGRDGGVRARMHQLVYGARHEAIGDEEVLFDAEICVAAFKVASTIVLDAMAQRQVLSARRCSDRVGLHKAQLVEGAP